MNKHVMVVPEDERVVVGRHIEVNSLLSVVAVIQELLIMGTCVVAAEVSGAIAVYVFAVIVIGSRLRALNNLVHEASHNLLSTFRRLNTALGLGCAVPTLLSFSEYKRSHMRHHARLGCNDDPDLIRLKELGLHPLPARVSVGKLLAGFPRLYVRYLLGSLYLAGKLSLARRIGALSIIGAVLSAAVGERAVQIVILYWLVPFLTSYQAIKFIAETGEHTGLYQRFSHESDVRFKAIHMTRNTLVGALPAFFLYPYGDNFHMLHHRYPSVPGFNLPSLHAQLLSQNWYSMVGYPDNCPLWGEGSLLNLLMR